MGMGAAPAKHRAVLEDCPGGDAGGARVEDGLQVVQGVTGQSLSSLERMSWMGAVCRLGAPEGMASPGAAQPLRGAQAAGEPPALGLRPSVPRR